MINAQMMPSILPMGGTATPFLLSGTFASDADGWDTTGGLDWVNSTPRTSPGVLYGSGGTRAEYVIPANMGKGLIINVSVWHRAVSSSTNRRLAYRFGSGSEVTLAQVNNSSTTYGEFTGVIDFTGPSDDLAIIIETVSGAQTRFDDWTISGVKP